MKASPAIREIVVIHHTHTDIGFTHPPRMVWELHRRFIDEAIELCEATGRWPEISRVRWTCETTEPLVRWLQQASPRQVARLRRLVRRGQIGAGAVGLNLTPLYNLPELVRHLEPVAALRKTLGLPLKVAINNDVNGLPWTVSDLLLDTGVELLTMGVNVHFGGYPGPRPRAFHWETPSGRRLLAFNGEHYQSFDREARIGEGTIEAMAAGLEAYLERLGAGGYPYDFVHLSATHHCFPDNNPPNPRTAGLIRQWNEEQRQPPIRYVLPEDLIGLLARQPAGSVPVHKGDWTDHWSFGIGSSAAETKVNRRARQKLQDAETLRALAKVATPKTPASVWSDAWRSVQLYDEHSWGTSATLRTTPAEPGNEQWYQKAINAYEAHSLAGIAFRDTIEQWAGPTAAGSKPSGVLLYNPSSVEKTGWARIPESIARGTWESFSSQVLQLEVLRDLNQPAEGQTPNSFSAPAPTVLAGPFTLPAFGFRYLGRREIVPASIPPELKARPGRIESAHFRLNYDIATGRILQLHDKARQADLIDATSPWSFFGFVREMPDPAVHSHQSPERGREAFFTMDWSRINLGRSCWKTDWTARRQTPGPLIEHRAQVTPQGATLTLRWEVPGARDFSQKITLEAHQPRVICEASFNKTDELAAESIYFTFPFALRNWRAHFDTAGMPVEFEHEQLAGSCRDWVAVDSWVALHNAGSALTLACPDAPLVQIGGFRFARGNRPSDRAQPPLLAAWPMNNYWNTNFKPTQPGWVQFRYVLAAQAAFDPLASAQVGSDARTQIEWQPVASPPLRKRGHLATVSGAQLIHASRQNRSCVVGLLNARPEPARATLRLPSQDLVSARRISAAGRRLEALIVRRGELQVTLPPRSLLLASLQLR